MIPLDEESTLTLFNVQEPREDSDDDLTPEERGQAVIEELADRAGIEYMTYERRVEIADDIERTVLETVPEYDTICIGATRSGTVSQAVFGSLPETVGERTDRTVVMARGPEESTLSLREAIVRRLER